jgi:hypothetical protein
MHNTARFGAMAGAGGSIALMMHVAPRMPVLLVVLIGGWVVAPFVILTLVESVAARWPAPVRTTIQAVIVVTAIVSLAIYAASAFGPPRPKPAFYFVLVPPVSVAVAAAAIAIAGYIARRQS